MSFGRHLLGHSGCSPLFPVNPRHGGWRPGQNRDKLLSAPSSPKPTSTALWVAMAAAVGLSGNPSPRRRRRETENSSSPDKDLRDKQVRSEVQHLVEEHHRTLKDDGRAVAGAIYARFSTNHQHSIADQVRACLEWASRNNVRVPLENVFFDMGIRGRRDRRPGLDELRAAIQADHFATLVVFAMSRLFRKAHEALRFVQEEIVDLGKRCVFLSNSIDTANQNPALSLHIHAMLDEQQSVAHAHHVVEGHKGLFDAGIVTGTITFGYTGEPIANQLTKKGGPRQRLIVDPETSQYVKRIFEWFVLNHVSIKDIVRRLNADESIPLPPKARSGQWTHLAVKTLLSNARYRGDWCYGKTQTIWQSRKDYARQVERDSPLRSTHREDLRIIEDATWYAAQERLAKRDTGAVGRKGRSESRKEHPRLLNGIFRCPSHEQALHGGGQNGESMLCPVCNRENKDSRPLYSYLPRRSAMELTCQVICELIRGDADLCAKVAAAFRQQAECLQRPDPAELARLQDQRRRLTDKINFILDNVGESEQDRRESQTTLRQCRHERQQTEWKISILQKARDVRVPTEEEIRISIDQIAATLIAAVDSEDAETLAKARGIVELITGGVIYLTQGGERTHGKGWLVGTFQPRLVDAICGSFGPDWSVSVQEDVPVVTIEYRRDQSKKDLQKKVIHLLDLGWQVNEIAKQLKIHRNRVAALIQRHQTDAGLPPIDLTKRRGQIQKKGENALHKRIANKVMELFRQNKSYKEIAAECRCSHPIVMRAIRYWHELRGLPAPDGRTRRKTLPHKHSPSKAANTNDHAAPNSEAT